LGNLVLLGKLLRIARRMHRSSSTSAKARSPYFRTPSDTGKAIVPRVQRSGQAGLTSRVPNNFFSWPSRA
jgi:hypothetical protein